MKKRPMFKTRAGLAEIVNYDGYSGFYVQPAKDWPVPSRKNLYRVRVTDARELTAEQAVQRVLQRVSEWENHESILEAMAGDAGMTANVKNGKVIVRRSK